MASFLSSLGSWAPLVVFLLAAAESAAFVGVVVPGELAVILGGVAAGTGNTPLWLVTVAATTGAVIGDSIGYRLGSWMGPALLGKPRMAKVSAHLDSAARLIGERGWWALVVARFAALLRAVVPFAAGLGRMPYRRFLLGNVIGGVAWGVTFTVAGYLAGTSYPTVERWMRTGGLTVVGLAVVIGGIVWATRWIQGHRETVVARLQRIATRQPFSWIAAGIARANRPAVTLAVAAIGIVAGFWAFGALAQDVVKSEEFFVLDIGAINYLEAHPVPAVINVAKAINAATQWPWLVAIAGAAALAAVARRHFRLGAIVALAVGGQWLIVQVTASLIHRAPPAATPLAARVDYGFPSEHVALAAALLMLAAWPWTRPGWKATVARLGAALVAVTLIAASRVVLIVEYPSDVLAAAAIAGSWTFLVCLVLQGARAVAVDAAPDITATGSTSP